MNLRGHQIRLLVVQRGGAEMTSKTPGKAWWDWIDAPSADPPVRGLVTVATYDRDGRPAEECALMEKAAAYGADAVFFEATQSGRPATAQAFVYASNSVPDDLDFAKLHRQLWSWGGVPLIYRKNHGRLQLFRCAHQADFLKGTQLRCNPVSTFAIAAEVSADPWWDAERLYNGSLWNDADTCKHLLSSQKAAHKSLFDAIKDLSELLDESRVLQKSLRRRLVILSLLIAYLEQRKVFPKGYFGRFQHGADRFFEVLCNGEALVALLKALEDRFNGNVFNLSDEEVAQLLKSQQLGRFASLVEGRQESNGQLTLWELYSFKDLPIELISQIYQLFVHDIASSVYTPPFLVRFLVDETLSWDRIDRLHANGEIILDPACGSGVFLVEAYKRLVLHWRTRNQWMQPDVTVLRGLMTRLRGVDIEQGAVELAAFSLCLALCDALEPEAIRKSIKLFPVLAGQSLHHSCFFEAKRNGLLTDPVGVILGNPPFRSKLGTSGAEQSYANYRRQHGEVVPDKQIGYLFLHEAMDAVVPGGVLCMLQQYNFLYNQKSLSFRRRFLRSYDVREIIDLVSVRGLFGAADTKIVVVVAEKNAPNPSSKVLHVTFRRSGRTEAEQGFELDYYDLHQVPLALALKHDLVWRANLMGGARALDSARRLAGFPTLKQFAYEQGWEIGEGFIEGQKGKLVLAPHLTGKPYLPSMALKTEGPDLTQLTTVKGKRFKTYYSERRFTPPMLLIRENKNLDHWLWDSGYLTYSQQIVGICAPSAQKAQLKVIDGWLKTSIRLQQAHLALSSPRLFAQKATALQADDVFSLIYPPDGRLDLSVNEQIVLDDVVDYYDDLIRLGDKSGAMQKASPRELAAFNQVYCAQLSAIYRRSPLTALAAYTWSGAICQPFCFGSGKIDWSDAEQLRDKINLLLHQEESKSLGMTGIVRLYDGPFIFLLKTDRVRHWMRSVALRDADETMADLRDQGF